VDFGFLNFTTLDKRKFYCEQELVLNQRLCPSLYLETIVITHEGDTFAINGKGEPIEYGVKMARMPEERMMVNVIARGELDKGFLDRIVEILVSFYEKAEGGEALAEFGLAKSVAVNVLENFEQTEGFIGCPALSAEQFEAISSYAKDFLAKESLFAERIKAGRIRDGRIRDCHGDLYSANICLADEVYIFDCIEFNERFRYCDVASDVAFLAMDLDYHGLADLSAYFVDRFVEKSGDEGLKIMLNFYKCYRAYVRGKIGLFTAHAPEVDDATKTGCFAQAKKYFELAQSYAKA
jgi:aminoglycoside phosphotransferase family enzyme